MIPSSEAMADNIRKHCEGIAREIAWRVKTESNGGLKTIDSKMVERHALGALLDWYLGDFVPSERRNDDAARDP